jgi:hypothetical protein
MNALMKEVAEGNAQLKNIEQSSNIIDAQTLKEL